MSASSQTGLALGARHLDPGPVSAACLVSRPFSLPPSPSPGEGRGESKVICEPQPVAGPAGRLGF